MTVRFKQLSKTSTEWASLNPTLLEGEIGFESDTNRLKVGTGDKVWNDLEYVTGSGSDLDTSNLVDLTNAQTITGTKTFIKGFKLKEYDTYTSTCILKYDRGLVFGGPNNDSYYTDVGYQSLSIGSMNTKATGLASVALGSAIVTGTSSIGIGTNNGNLGLTVSGDHSFAIACANIDAPIDVSKDYSFNIQGFELLDLQTGLIPNDRLGLGNKKYLHRITLNLSDQASGSPPNKTAVIHLDYYSDQETAYTNPNFATIALTNSIGCSGYYIDTDVSLTEKNFVYEIALPQSNEFVLNNNVSITIQSTGSSITDEVIGYVLS